MNGIEEIRQKVESKIEKNTEYTVLMNGKVQKFAYYDVKENGRLCLLNTKYGSFTFMTASYFIKHISSKKHFISKRPYNVEYPEDYKAKQTSSTGELLNNDIEKREECLKKEDNKTVDKETAEMLKWASRLKTLPERESEILEKELKIAPRKLGEDLEMWGKNGVIVSPLQTLTAYEKAKNLLKGTEWDVK